MRTWEDDRIQSLDSGDGFLGVYECEKLIKLYTLKGLGWQILQQMKFASKNEYLHKLKMYIRFVDCRQYFKVTHSQ